MDEVLRLSAGELAARIRDGRYRPSDVLETHIRRLLFANPLLNALVGPNFERARSLAAEADRLQTSGGELPPLFGVPFAVPESLALSGCSHTSGSRFRSARYAEEDATAVTRLIEAGAIPIGVANTSELAFWIETNNPVFGKTGNPWDTARGTGGSAGGVAALIASNCVTFGLGIDMVGSLRVAGHFCGVFAHKPTGGRVPLSGMEPLPDGRMRRYTGLGPLARSAQDLQLILDIIAGPDGVDKATLEFPERDEREWDPMWKRVVVCDDFGVPGVRVHPQVRQAIKEAAELLHEQGAEVEVWRPRQLHESFWIWMALVHEGYGLTWHFADRITGESEEHWVRELMRAPLGRSRVSAPVLAMALTEKMTKGSFLRIQRLAAEGRRLRERLSTVLNNGGVMLTPAFGAPAVKHGRTMLKARSISHTAIFNTLELPCSVVPMGVYKKLPVGVQIIADHGRDDVAIAAAARIAALRKPHPSPRLRRLRFGTLR